MVPREEAVKVCAELSRSIYCDLFRLYENVALRSYMSQLAEDEPDAEMCSKCRNFFFASRKEWEMPLLRSREHSSGRGRRNTDASAERFAGKTDNDRPGAGGEVL